MTQTQTQTTPTAPVEAVEAVAAEVFPARPATQIDPPVRYSLPARKFASRSERKSRNTGASLLSEVKPAATPVTYPSTSPYRTLPPKSRALPRDTMEYHLRMDGRTSVFRPCRVTDGTCDTVHVDTKRRVLRVPRRPVTEVALPPFSGPVMGSPTPVTPTDRWSASRPRPTRSPASSPVSTTLPASATSTARDTALRMWHAMNPRVPLETP